MGGGCSRGVSGKNFILVTLLFIPKQARGLYVKKSGKVCSQQSVGGKLQAERGGRRGLKARQTPCGTSREGSEPQAERKRRVSRSEQRRSR